MNSVFLSTNLNKCLLLRRIQNVKFTVVKACAATHAKEQAARSNVFKDYPTVVRNISKIIQCTEAKALEIYDEIPVLRSAHQLRLLKENCMLFAGNGVSMESITENVLLLTMDTDGLQRKLKMVKNMKPRHIDDFVPLLYLSTTELRIVTDKLIKEQHMVPNGNRIYYLSRKLKVEPKIAAAYCARCSQVFKQPFKRFSKNLRILMDYNVKPIEILQGMYVFLCSPERFIRNLERTLDAGLPDVNLKFFTYSDEKFKAAVNDLKIEKDDKAGVESLRRYNSAKAEIFTFLKSYLYCSDVDAKLIYYNHLNEIDELPIAKRNVKMLTENGVNLPAIVKSPNVLTLTRLELQERLDILQEMKPAHIDDIFPLIKADAALLRSFLSKLQNHNGIGADHPIYYFSEKLKIPPYSVASKLADRLELYNLNPKLLKSKLDLLLAYNISPEKMLNAHVFRISKASLEECIKNFRTNGIQDITSWLLCIRSNRMERLIARRVEEEKSKDGFDKSIDYLAHRLNWTVRQTEEAVKREPYIASISATKVKKHLDFLMDVANYTAEDISSHLNILKRNLNELKTRNAEMDALNITSTHVKCLMVQKSRRIYLRDIEIQCRKNIKDPRIAQNFDLVENRIKMELAKRNSLKKGLELER